MSSKTIFFIKLPHNKERFSKIMLVILFSFLLVLSLVVLFLNRHENINFSISMMVGLIVIATTSFFDDIYNISILKRVVLYGLAIIASIIILEPEQKIMIGNISVDFGSLSYVVYAIYIFWVLNLFNFMDGMDGLTALQMIFLALTINFISLMNYLDKFLIRIHSSNDLRSNSLLSNFLYKIFNNRQTHISIKESSPNLF